MFCSRTGNGIPITCTTTYQKWTGQPIHLAGSKNPLPLGMGSVNPDALNHSDVYIDVPQDKFQIYAPAMSIIISNFLPNVAVKPLALAMGI